MRAIEPVFGEFVETPIDKAPEPNLDTTIIPKSRYISTEFMAKEWQHMWTRCWLIGCREDEILEVGDYVTTEIGKESLLIARGEDDVARAFHNVCPYDGCEVAIEARSGLSSVVSITISAFSSVS